MAKPKTRVRFAPSEAQRAFVAAATGLGVPASLICRMLPGAAPGETVAIDGASLARHFEEECRQGLRLALSLAAARLFAIALAGADRPALTALRLILKTPTEWDMLGEASREGQAGRFSGERLSRQERAALRKLLAKGTTAPKAAE